MMHVMTLPSVIALMLLSAAPTYAAPYTLPLTLDDSNTSVTFEVDSTWHLVKGSTAGISGTVWHEDTADPNAIAATISIPVQQFDTDNSDRDERMREVLHAAQYPFVKYTLQQLQTECPASMNSGHDPCTIQLRGTVEISGTQRPLEISGTMEREENGFLVRGATTLSWKDFGVEDPSIFIARLDENVHISFQVHLPLSNS